MKRALALTLLAMAGCSREGSDNDAAAVNIDAAANRAVERNREAAARPAPRTPSRPITAAATASPLARPTPVSGAAAGDVVSRNEAATAGDLPPVVSARYRCVDGSRYLVRFDNRADTATLTTDGKTIATLIGQRPASGIWYKADGWELRGKGREATLTKPDGPALPCIS